MDVGVARRDRSDGASTCRSHRTPCRHPGRSPDRCRGRVRPRQSGDRGRGRAHQVHQRRPAASRRRGDRPQRVLRPPRSHRRAHAPGNDHDRAAGRGSSVLFVTDRTDGIARDSGCRPSPIDARERVHDRARSRERRQFRRHRASSRRRRRVDPRSDDDQRRQDHCAVRRPVPAAAGETGSGRARVLRRRHDRRDSQRRPAEHPLRRAGDQAGHRRALVHLLGGRRPCRGQRNRRAARRSPRT